MSGAAPRTGRSIAASAALEDCPGSHLLRSCISPLAPPGTLLPRASPGTLAHCGSWTLRSWTPRPRSRSPRQRLRSMAGASARFTSWTTASYPMVDATILRPGLSCVILRTILAPSRRKSVCAAGGPHPSATSCETSTLPFAASGPHMTSLVLVISALRMPLPLSSVSAIGFLKSGAFWRKLEGKELRLLYKQLVILNASSVH